MANEQSALRTYIYINIYEQFFDMKTSRRKVL